MSDKDFQKRMANKRTLRGDVSKMYRYARRAMFKDRNNPRAILSAAAAMGEARKIGAANGFEVSGAIQSYQGLKDTVYGDIARDIDKSKDISEMLNKLSAPAPDPAAAEESYPDPGSPIVTSISDEEELKGYQGPTLGYLNSKSAFSKS